MICMPYPAKRRYRGTKFYHSSISFELSLSVSRSLTLSLSPRVELRNSAAIMSSSVPSKALGSGWSKFVGGGGMRRHRLVKKKLYADKSERFSMVLPGAMGMERKTMAHLQQCTVKLKDNVRGIHVALAGKFTSQGTQ